MYNLVEAKLPKGYKWSDTIVIKETSPYKGMFHNYDKEKHKVANIVVKLTSYKQLTATEAISILCQDVVIAHAMIFTVWKKLGLPLGLIQPVLRPLIQQNLQEA